MATIGVPDCNGYNKAEVMVGLCSGPPRMKKQTKYSRQSWEKSHNCWPLFSWGTSINTTQQ